MHVELDQHPLILERWRYLADKLEGAPSLLEIPLANIERWIGAGRLGGARFLKEWHEKISQAKESQVEFGKLMDLLRDDGERALQLKSCSPFPGVFTREERDRFTCSWTH